MRAITVTRAPKFSVRYMDKSADPRKDFYRYSAGKWMKTHPVPADKSRWGSFSELYEWNLLMLKRIAERSEGAPDSPEAKLVGDSYHSAMDVKRVEAARFNPIDDLWDLADGISSADELATSIPKFHVGGAYPLFGPFSKPDDKNASVYALFMYQGGLSLPDRDYYLSDSFAAIRKQYEAHVSRMFALKGVRAKEATKWARDVLSVETALAKSSRTRTDLRDREKNYNRMEKSALEAKYPNLSLPAYLDGIDAKTASYVVVGQPEFFDSLTNMIKKRELDEWRAYLRWQVLSSFAPYLHRKVELEDFNFFHRKLLGQKEQEPRWKRALRVVDDMIGEALGKLYVKECFPEEAHRRASVLVDDLRHVFEKRLASLPWMTEATRQLALAKFKVFRVKIGHPEKFRDYSGLTVRRDDLVGNVRRARGFEFKRQVSRIGGPVDLGEWQMTPPTVNAYFDETMNEIVFPAGILQPPFFDPALDDAVNYGAIGVVIGHEITHGFDDQGRRYDAKGNLKDWWTSDDEKEFKKRADAVVKAYSAQEVLPGKYVNGELTLGENIADLGGVSIAYEALQRRLEEEPAKRRHVDGMTPEQRFYVSYSQVWRQTIRKQEALRLLTIDPHSPGKVRGSLPAVNHPDFEAAFPSNGKEQRGKVELKIGVW